MPQASGWISGTLKLIIKSNKKPVKICSHPALKQSGIKVTIYRNLWGALLPLKVIPIMSSIVGGIGLGRLLLVDFFACHWENLVTVVPHYLSQDDIVSPEVIFVQHCSLTLFFVHLKCSNQNCPAFLSHFLSFIIFCYWWQDKVVYSLEIELEEIVEMVDLFQCLCSTLSTLYYK